MQNILDEIKNCGKVYCRFSTPEKCVAFFEKAENAGFMFGAEKPTSKHPSDIIAVEENQISYVSTSGRMAIQSNQAKVIDY